jgi:hypothetical protein
MGTPITGRGVWEAVMPGRCAAPPAPAMTTSNPSSSALLANSAVKSGVLWALTALAS